MKLYLYIFILVVFFLIKSNYSYSRNKSDEKIQSQILRIKITDTKDSVAEIEYYLKFNNKSFQDKLAEKLDEDIIINNSLSELTLEQREARILPSFRWKLEKLKAKNKWKPRIKMDGKKYLCPFLRKILKNYKEYSSNDFVLKSGEIVLANGEISDLETILDILEAKIKENPEIDFENLVKIIPLYGIIDFSKKFPENAIRVYKKRINLKNEKSKFNEYLNIFLGHSGCSGCKEVKDQLISIATNINHDIRMRDSAVRALKNFKDEEVIQVLKKALSDNALHCKLSDVKGRKAFYSVRLAAVSSLQELGVPIDIKSIKLTSDTICPDY